MHSYDEEENAGFGLADLAEDSEEDAPLHANGTANGHGKGSFTGPADQERPSRPPVR
jgi:magnesium transporter